MALTTLAVSAHRKGGADYARPRDTIIGGGRAITLDHIGAVRPVVKDV